MNPRLFSLIYCTPWNIDGKHWQGMHMAAQAPGSLSFEDFFSAREKMEIDSNGIAHISITGTLGEGVAADEKLFGDSHYSSISAEVREAKQAARGIMYHVDSPGGLAVGCVECGTDAASAGIPTAAHIYGMGCSAAYAAIAGVDRITAIPSAFVGSIGTILPMLDFSGLWEKMGVKADYVQSGDLKAAGYMPSQTPEERAALQQEVDDLGAQFRKHVTRFRNVPNEAMRGQAFIADRAKGYNLIDAVSTFEDAYSALLKKTMRKG